MFLYQRLFTMMLSKFKRKENGKRVKKKYGK